MKRFRVKVCGVTRPKDAALAAGLGADMIGLIFYRRSPRFVPLKQAERIIRSLPPVVARAGVFVDEAPEKMLRVADRLKLDFIQLHGDEPAGVVALIQKAGYRVIKAYPIRQASDYRKVIRSRADLCLLDHATHRLRGGTGSAFDWSLRPRRKIPNLVLAGGVEVGNVARGVELFDPIMIDVNSGVETGPGVKSRAKLKTFFAECDRLRYGTQD